MKRLISLDLCAIKSNKSAKVGVGGIGMRVRCPCCGFAEMDMKKCAVIYGLGNRVEIDFEATCTFCGSKFGKTKVVEI